MSAQKLGRRNKRAGLPTKEWRNMTINQVLAAEGRAVRVCFGFEGAPPDAVGTLVRPEKDMNGVWTVLVLLREHRGAMFVKELRVSLQRFNASFRLTTHSP